MRMGQKVLRSRTRVNQTSGAAGGPWFALSPRAHVDSQTPRVAELGMHTGTVLEATRMRFIGRALLASVFVLGACAGGDKNASRVIANAAPPTLARKSGRSYTLLARRRIHVAVNSAVDSRLSRADERRGADACASTPQSMLRGSIDPPPFLNYWTVTAPFMPSARCGVQ